MLLLLDKIHETLIEGLKAALGKSGNYPDLYVPDVIDRDFSDIDPNRTMYVIYGEAVPAAIYEIGQSMPTEWNIPFQIRVMAKSADQGEARRIRAVLMARAMRELFNMQPGALGRNIYSLSDSENGITESVIKIEVRNTAFANAKDKSWRYLGAINVNIKTEVAVSDRGF